MAKEPVTFTVPPGAQAQSCRGCQAVIFWILTSLGNKMPVNADGTSHFATCPDANKFRKPKA